MIFLGFTGFERVALDLHFVNGVTGVSYLTASEILESGMKADQIFSNSSIGSFLPGSE